MKCDEKQEKHNHIINEIHNHIINEIHKHISNNPKDIVF